MISMTRGHRGLHSLLIAGICFLLGSSGCSKAPTPPVPAFAQPSDAHAAARSGDVAKLRQLIDEGADLETVLATDDTSPLMAAAEREQIACVKLLIEAGVDVERADRDGATALHHAAGKGNDGAVAALLEGGANIEARDQSGMTALLYAASGGYPTTIDVLLKYGADLHSVDDSGMTALFWSALSDHGSCTETLLDAGADLEARDAEGKTPLLAAAKEGAADSVKLLLQRGADLTAHSNMGLTALHYAAYSDNRQTIEEVIEAGAPVDARTETGKTPLMYGVLGYGFAVNLLAYAFADLDSEDDKGQTAVIYAITSGRSDGWALNDLLDHGADVNKPLYAAAMESDVDVVAELLNLGASPDSPAPAGGTIIDAVRDPANQIANRDEILALMGHATQDSSNN